MSQERSDVEEAARVFAVIESAWLGGEAPEASDDEDEDESPEEILRALHAGLKVGVRCPILGGTT